MTKTTPDWYQRPFGNIDQNSWDEAMEQSIATLRRWASTDHVGTYGEFINDVEALEWPDGGFTAHGSQVGYLLGVVGIHEWLEDRPLLSSLVVRSDDGGLGLPGGGWFDFVRRLGLLTDEHNENEKLRVWSDQVKACFKGGRFDYPTPEPEW